MRDDPAIEDVLGERIRRLRQRRGLTLDALAERSGVSRAMLSRVERGGSSPTAQLLGRVCAGLGLPLAELFGAPETSRASPLARRRDQPVWRDPETGYRRRAVSPPGTGSPVSVAAIELPPGASVAFDPLPLPRADQHLWVLDGELEIARGGDEPERLEAGDCLHMRFERPVVFRNRTERVTRYAVILCQGAEPS